jgi:DNA-binding Xre family transcriptional regulator
LNCLDHDLKAKQHQPSIFMSDYTAQLRLLMQAAQIPSFRALSRMAQTSDWQIEQLRKGQVKQLRVETLLKLSSVLHQSIDQLIATFSEPDSATPSAPQPTDAEPTLQSPPPVGFAVSGSVEHYRRDAQPNGDLGGQLNLQQLQQEYDRLQTRLAQQKAELLQEFQQTSLQILESWLLQFPTVVYAVQQNPQVPASRLLPLIRPVEQLIASWGIELLEPVGAEVAYNPQFHQLMEGEAQTGDRVKIRYPGYRQGEKLLYRARVSPVLPV